MARTRLEADGVHLDDPPGGALPSVPPAGLPWLRDREQWTGGA